MTKQLIYLFIMLTCSNSTLAQRLIRGKVTDVHSKMDLIGVSVSTKVAKNIATTDIDGNYQLSVPDSTQYLTFSLMGYFAKTMFCPKSLDTLNVELQADWVAVDSPYICNCGNFVDLGYKKLSKDQYLGSSDEQTDSKFNRGNVYDAWQLLQGRVAGLHITRVGDNPNENFAIRLRGVSSLVDATPPLVVVDGVPNVDLWTVDPNNIATIHVLRDVATTALYGAQGANGVLLVTTKRTSNRKFEIKYNHLTTYSQISRRVPVLSAAEFLAQGGRNQGAQTDWTSAITRNGIGQAHHLSLSGHNGIAYNLDLNFRDVQGSLLHDGFKKWNSRLHLGQTFKKFKWQVDGSATAQYAQIGQVKAFEHAVSYNPTSPVTDELNGVGGFKQVAGFNYYNPVAIVEQSVYDRYTQQFIGNVSFTYDINNNLSWKTRYAYNSKNNLEGQYYSPDAYFRGAFDGFAKRQTIQEQRQYGLTTLDYRLYKYANWKWNALLGMEFQSFQRQLLDVQGYGFTNGAVGYNAVESATQGLSRYETTSKRDLGSAFGRVDWSAHSILFGAAGVRFDNRNLVSQWQPFGSLGFDLGQILRIPNLYGKLRTGYGIANKLSNRDPQHFVISINAPPLVIQAFGSSLVGHQRKAEWNTGLDLQYRKFKLGFDYYQAISSDWYFSTVTNTWIVPNITINDKNTSNILKIKGLEMSLDYNWVQKQHFNWTTALRLSTTQTIGQEIKVGYDSVERRQMAYIGDTRDFAYIGYAAGQPIGEFFGYKYAGEVSSQGEPFVILPDGRKVTISTASNQGRQVLGNALPKVIFSLNNFVKYKKLEINVLISGSLGHSLMNENRYAYEYPFTSGSSTSINKVRTSLFNPNLKTLIFTSHYIERADFVRLSNVRLSYEVYRSEKGIRRFDFFVSGDNLLTFTAYTGVDPEVRYSTQVFDRFAPAYELFETFGMDRKMTYLPVRSYSVGLQVAF
jgi:TonB-dependent starch-binding outer membrane protein SusC